MPGCGRMMLPRRWHRLPPRRRTVPARSRRRPEPAPGRAARCRPPLPRGRSAIAPAARPGSRFQSRASSSPGRARRPRRIRCTIAPVRPGRGSMGRSCAAGWDVGLRSGYSLTYRKERGPRTTQRRQARRSQRGRRRQFILARRALEKTPGRRSRSLCMRCAPRSSSVLKRDRWHRFEPNDPTPSSGGPPTADSVEPGISRLGSIRRAEFGVQDSRLTWYNDLIMALRFPTPAGVCHSDLPCRVALHLGNNLQQQKFLAQFLFI